MDANNTPTAINRKRADYPPSVWGDYFCKYAYDDSPNDHDIPHEKIRELKEEVRRMIRFDAEKPLRTLDLIDQVQRLGISYHFESEIEHALKQTHKFYFEVPSKDMDGDLYLIALLFRLLRQEGYKISCDVFNKFEEKKGRFIESLANDLQGLLSLYEASDMRIHGEEILENALVFSLTHLRTSLENELIVTPLLRSQVMHELNHPIRKGFQRVAVRQYFQISQQDPFHIDNLLTLAKLDFNLVQNQHQKELGELSRWWKELNFKEKFPFARDRLVECYFWVTGVFFEPQYALGRKLLCKVLVMIIIIDDAYDVYGTTNELELLTKAIQRWERGAQDMLPNCMQVLYEALLDLYDEIETLLSQHGKSRYLHYAKEGMKTLVRGYMEEARWLHQNRIPSMQEYMSTAIVTSAQGVGAVVAFLGMGDIITNDVLELALTNPKIIRASAIILRLSDDIGSRKFERKREHIPSAVECYMNEHQVTEEEAEGELSRLISDAWKDINEESLNPIFHMTILKRIINLACVPNFIYKGEDRFTNGHPIKDTISSLYIEPVQL